MKRMLELHGPPDWFLHHLFLLRALDFLGSFGRYSLCRLCKSILAFLALIACPACKSGCDSPCWVSLSAQGNRASLSCPLRFLLYTWIYISLKARPPKAVLACAWISQSISFLFFSFTVILLCSLISRLLFWSLGSSPLMVRRREFLPKRTQDTHPDKSQQSYILIVIACISGHEQESSLHARHRAHFLQ